MADTTTTQKKYISQVVISGITYNIKDTEARAQLSKIVGTVGSVMAYRGTTTTALTDGATTTPVTIGGKDYTPVQGDVVAYLNREYAWSGTAWFEFGSTGSLKALAFADTASGTVSIPSTTHTHNIDIPTGVVQGSVTASAKYTPAGKVTTFHAGDKNAASGAYTPRGNNAKSNVTLTGGSTGKMVTDSIIVPKDSMTARLVTDAGKAPTLTVTSKDIPNVTSVGAMFQATVDETSETLTLTAGKAPTLGQKITVGSASNWSAGQMPGITDTLPVLYADYDGTENKKATFATGEVTAAGTGATVATALPTGGTAEAQTFTGTPCQVGFQGTENSITVSGSTSGVALTTETVATEKPSATSTVTVTVEPVK